MPEESKFRKPMKIPYNIIRQLPASNIILQNVFAHIAIGSKDPLVMAFAGPSGHRMTEMARHIGGLLSVDITVIGCARVKGDVGLLGSRAGYRRLERGISINQFSCPAQRKMCCCSLGRVRQNGFVTPSLRLRKIQNPPSKFRLF